MSVLKRVIPCLDVDKGRVVKGTNFVGLRDAGDPVELAERYDAEGADELVFLDITASHEARDTIVKLARRTADNVFIPFTIGGGIRSVEDAQAVLDAGADKVSVNSAALDRPELISELAEVFVPFTIGGGIRSAGDAQGVLDAGADKVSVNSAAVARPELIDELDAVMSRKTSSSAPSPSYTAAISTGSPASRRPVKLTPFTTRPASTSRHGMTRATNIRPTSLPRQ